ASTHLHAVRVAPDLRGGRAPPPIATTQKQRLQSTVVHTTSASPPSVSRMTCERNRCDEPVLGSRQLPNAADSRVPESKRPWELNPRRRWRPRSGRGGSPARTRTARCGRRGLLGGTKRRGHA